MDSTSWLKDILSIIRDFPKSTFHYTSIFSVFLIFCIKYWVIEIPAQNLWIFSVGILFSFSMSLGDIFQRIFNFVKKIIRKMEEKRVLIKVLNSLDSNEKEALCEFYYEKRNTVGFNSADATVVGLVEKKVLIRTGSFSSGGKDAHKINDYLKSIINAEVHLDLSRYMAIKEENSFY